MNLVIAIGAVFVAVIVGSHRQVIRASSDSDAQRGAAKERAAMLEQWTLTSNNIH